MDTMRPIDGNGHVPEPEVVPDPAAACCNECMREHPAYQLGRHEAILDMIGAIARQAQANLDAILEKLAEREAA